MAVLRRTQRECVNPRCRNMESRAYILVTAARNEDRYIRKTLQSVVDQTHLPKLWLVVSDGSTDLADRYVQDLAGRYSFIRLVRLDSADERSFSSKSFALNAGDDEIRDIESDFIGILDADISLPPDYYQQRL